jgi:hypothetical protein
MGSRPSYKRCSQAQGQPEQWAGAGKKLVGGKTENLTKVLDALRAAGVELVEDGLRLVRKGR